MPLATMQQAVNEYVQNVADLNPEHCACRGSGWTLSNYDSWHPCPAHHRGQPHPEDYCGGCGEHHCICPPPSPEALLEAAQWHQAHQERMAEALKPPAPYEDPFADE